MGRELRPPGGLHSVTEARAGENWTDKGPHPTMFYQRGVIEEVLAQMTRTSLWYGQTP